MNKKLAICGLVLASAIVPITGFASDDVDMDRSHPKAFVKDSAITMKVKAKLAAAHLSSVAHIKVDTDANGIVWLSGNARSQEEIDKAVSIAKTTEGVISVKNGLIVKKDD